MNELNILYEDNHIIVVVKPYNMLSQADNTKDIDLVSLVKKYLKDKYQKPGNVYLGLVHRLDRPVGGIMVLAKTSKAALRLSDSFKKHDIEKKYLAICQGKFSEEKGVFKDKIERLDNGNSIISNKGKEAVLEYQVLEYNKKEDCSLVEITLKTGRHHQIRVQFASRGHALLGDQRYGRQDKKQISLFAYKLEFVHPITKEWLKFKVLPEKKDYWTKFTL